MRVPSKEYHHIARALDMGAEGLMVPMVNDAEEARAILDCMKYVPEGKRGVALGVAHDHYTGGAVMDKLAAANKRSTLFAQIETAAGVENADEIAALDGVDCLWVGHFDLTCSLGIPGEFDHPKFKDAIARTYAACKKHNKAYGRLVPGCRDRRRRVRPGLRLHLLFRRRLGVRGGAEGRRRWHPERRQGQGRASAAARAGEEAGEGEIGGGGWSRSASRSPAISARPTARPTFPSFDLSPITGQAEHRDALGRCGRTASCRRAALTDCDALILLAHRFAREVVPPGDRLAAVARFGVGYDNVDLAACNEHGIAAVITPDGVRRPVAVSMITFILALSQKLLIKDKLTRQGPPGWAKRVDFMGEGLIGKTLGQLGMGNIGAEVFRMAAPFGMKFIAHDPYIDKAKAAELGVEVVSSDELFRRADFLSVSVPLSDATRHYVNAERLKTDEADRLSHQHGARADRRPEGALPGAGRQHDRRRRRSTCSRSSRRPPTSRSTSSRTSSSRRTRSAGPTSVSRATARPISPRSLEIMHGREPRGVVNKDVLANALWKRRLADLGARLRQIAEC